MPSKARHLADLIAVGARGSALGNTTHVSIKSDKISNTSVTRVGTGRSDDLLVANTTSDRIGIQTTNPQAVLDVEGDIRVGTDLEDNTGRVFKVYYANGDISWGE